MGRYRQFLVQRYRVILSYVGLMALISGATLLVPSIALFAYPEELSLAWGFWLPGLTLALVGLLLWQKLAPQESVSLTVPEGAAIVVFSWLLAIAFGSVPFLTVGELNLTQAVFESTSGWTTTGLSVVDVSRTSHLILLLRSLTQLVGGAGFAVIALSTLTVATGSGSGLVLAEGRSEQLVPQVRQSAKLVLSIYTGYVALGIIGLRGAGMDWFDAINHAFTALSTGGFSTRTESIGAWHSSEIEAVTIVLMLAGSLNYATSFLLLRGKWLAVRQ
jgi:trk system potassium uptake protein TrkH